MGRAIPISPVDMNLLDMDSVVAALRDFESRIDGDAAPKYIKMLSVLAASEVLEIGSRVDAVNAIRKIVEKADAADGDVPLKGAAALRNLQDLAEYHGADDLGEAYTALQASLFRRFPDARRAVFAYAKDAPAVKAEPTH